MGGPAAEKHKLLKHYYSTQCDEGLTAIRPMLFWFKLFTNLKLGSIILCM